MSSNTDHLVELLTEAALPNIYRTNAFRILELRATAAQPFETSDWYGIR